MADKSPTAISRHPTREILRMRHRYDEHDDNSQGQVDDNEPLATSEPSEETWIRWMKTTTMRMDDGNHDGNKG